MTKKCNILVKMSSIPRMVKDYLADDDILFSWTEGFVAVDSTDKMVEPYGYALPVELFYIPQKVLKELDDPELALLLMKAKIEREVMLLTNDASVALENSDYIIQQKYAEKLVLSTYTKLNVLFGLDEDYTDD